jgi:hypothetical protein
MLPTVSHRLEALERDDPFVHEDEMDQHASTKTVDGC